MSLKSAIFYCANCSVDIDRPLSFYICLRIFLPNARGAVHEANLYGTKYDEERPCVRHEVRVEPLEAQGRDRAEQILLLYADIARRDVGAVQEVKHDERQVF